ncbi:MAG TPA: energy transducer TonB [Thermoanaerobaculia bacterium]|nr:energy transducer TonB [Thermoanaerobaculia bacterium]
MFETVVPETVTKRSRALFYETLPLSLALHALAVVGVLVATVWKVQFPSQSPKLFAMYNLADPPPPPPPPPPPAPPRVVQRIQPAPVRPQEIVAPTVIPDVIPDMTQEPPPVDAIEGPVESGVEGGVPGGIAGGAVGGVVGGEVGGEHGGTVGGIVTDNRIHIARDKPLPMFPVSQVYPAYPEQGRLRHWEDTLVVRYTIGKNGRITEVLVISNAERKIFEEATVKAIKNWRFRPLVKDGEAQEVVHELTVYFRLEPTG